MCKLIKKKSLYVNFKLIIWVIKTHIYDLFFNEFRLNILSKEICPRLLDDDKFQLIEKIEYFNKKLDTIYILIIVL